MFIDARNLGHLINRRAREFADEDIARIADTYHNWRNPDGSYEDVPAFVNLHRWNGCGNWIMC